MTHHTLANIRPYAMVGNIVVLTLFTGSGKEIETYMGKIGLLSVGYNVLPPYHYFQVGTSTYVTLRCSWLTRLRSVNKWGNIVSKVPFRVPIPESILHCQEITFQAIQDSQGKFFDRGPWSHAVIEFDTIVITTSNRERIEISRCPLLLIEADSIEKKIKESLT